MLKKSINLKSLTVNLVLGPFKERSRFQIFYFVFFFVERDSMDSSHMLWNKIQDRPFFGKSV